MAYEPTNWKTGDVVTSAKLNKIEQGIKALSSPYIWVGSSSDDEAGTITLDCSGQDVIDAYNAGKAVMTLFMYNEIYEDEGKTTTTYYYDEQSVVYSAFTAQEGDGFGFALGGQSGYNLYVAVPVSELSKPLVFEIGDGQENTGISS